MNDKKNKTECTLFLILFIFYTKQMGLLTKKWLFHNPFTQFPHNQHILVGSMHGRIHLSTCMSPTNRSWLCESCVKRIVKRVVQESGHDSCTTVVQLLYKIQETWMGPTWWVPSHESHVGSTPCLLSLAQLLCKRHFSTRITSLLTIEKWYLHNKFTQLVYNTLTWGEIHVNETHHISFTPYKRVA
jgi:hypothetical protein